MQKIIAHFPDLATAWSAKTSDFIAAGLEQPIAEYIYDKRTKISPESEQEKLAKTGANVVLYIDNDYPRPLKDVYAPPPLLFYFGQPVWNDGINLAVVGSRKISTYGSQITEKICHDLAVAGITIVSGLALGVDSCAHWQAVKNKTITIGVLGSGIAQIYPASNKSLAKKIVALGGSIISEFPLNMPPLKYNFPQRNRLIAGLSSAVIVTEAAEKSGSLITASYALEQGKEVLAVPGNINQANSVGTNNLIKQGARPVTSAAEILDLIGVSNPMQTIANRSELAETAIEKSLLTLITAEPIHVDKLIRLARLDISAVNSALSILEMKGLIKNLGGQNYAKN